MSKFIINKNRPELTRKQTAAETVLVFMFAVIFTGVLVWGVVSSADNHQESWLNETMTTQEYSERVKENVVFNGYDDGYEDKRGKRF